MPKGGRIMFWMILAFTLFAFAILGWRLLLWIINAFIGVLPESTAGEIRRWGRFVIAVIILLFIIQACAG